MLFNECCLAAFNHRGGAAVYYTTGHKAGNSVICTVQDFPVPLTMVSGTGILSDHFSPQSPNFYADERRLPAESNVVPQKSR